MRLDEAFAVLLDLLFLPFVSVAARAGRDFFVGADALVDRVVLGDFACCTEAVATVSAPALVAAPFRSDLEGSGAVASDARTGCFLTTISLARSGGRSLNNRAAATPIMSPPSATATAGF